MALFLVLLRNDNRDLLGVKVLFIIDWHRIRQTRPTLL